MIGYIKSREAKANALDLTGENYMFGGPVHSYFNHEFSQICHIF